MTFTETRLKGVFIVEPDIHTDERGTFERTFDRWQFARHGMSPTFAETALSRNPRQWTLRGLHWQPGQAKLVRCSRGAIFDAVVNTLTHEAFGITLLNSLLYIPAGFAHGFLTLEPDTEVSYWLGAPFDAEATRGFRWDDPVLKIAWPAFPLTISVRDQTWPFIST